jgi:hypothetical protein
MAKERIDTGKAPALKIVCKGDMRLRGWSEPAMQVRGQAFSTEQGEKGYSITSDSDLSLMVPAGADVNIELAGADLAIKNLEGQLTVGEIKSDASLLNLNGVDIGIVNGDLSVKNLSGSFRAGEIKGDLAFRNVLDVNLNTVSGDCAARNVNGALTVDMVMGDFALRTINGDVTIDECHRDANLRNIGGRVTLTHVHGDVRLRGGLIAGKHNLNADGDVVVLWPSEAPLSIEATAPSIKNKLPLEDVTQDERSLSGRIGDGNAVLILNAQGRVILKKLAPVKDPWEQTANGDYTFDLGFDLADLGEQISDEISAHMSAWSQRMEDEFGPKFSAKIERKAEQVGAKAEKAAARAVRRAEKAANRARWGTGPTVKSGASAHKAQEVKTPKASEEEQLKILRMVENGVITPDEAVTLLEALE